MGVQIQPCEGAILGEMGAHSNVWRHFAVTCVKTDESIVVPFEL